MTDLASLVVRMQADNSSYVKALEQSQAKLEKFSKDQTSALTELTDKFAGLAGTLAAAFTVDKLVAFTASAIESAASLSRMSQAAGVSVEDLSSLRLAAAAAGLSQDDLGLALKKLNVNIAEAAGNANSKAGVAFRALGISVRDSSGNVRDAGAVLADLATKFAGYADGPEKVAIAVQLLGKAGQNMIPVLDKGASGLEAFKAQAQAAGVVISEKAAAAAEEFTSKLNVLKASLVDGFGAALSDKLVPVLLELVGQFESVTRGGSAFSVIASAIAFGVKVVASVVLEAAHEFQGLGAAIGALSAVAVAIAHGNFAEAANIWKASNEDEAASAIAHQAQMVALWKAGSAQELAIDAATDAAKKKKPPAPNLVNAEAVNAARLKLEEYSDSLRAQAAAFGLGKAALIEYDLQFGALSKDVKAAGAEGAAAVAKIRAFANALQVKIDAKAIKDYTNALQEQVIKYGQSALAAEKYKNTTGELGEALDRMADHGVAARAVMDAASKTLLWDKDQEALHAIDRETQTLTGHFAAAAAAAFDFANKALLQNTKDTGDTAGQAQLASLRAQAIAQGEFNEQIAKAAEVEKQLKVVEDQIELARAKGQVTDMAAEAQLNAARQAAIVQLQAINVAEQANTAAMADPKNVEAVAAQNAAIIQLKKSTDALTESVRANLESAFADNFEKLITGAESFRQAVMSMLKDVEKMFLDMIAKDYAQKLFGVGGAAGGASGGLSSLLGYFTNTSGGGAAAAGAGAGGGAAVSGSYADMLAGGFAAGGTIPTGSFGLVGEEGPELAYSGSQNLHIAPLASAAAKPITVHNNFMIDAPGGTISRQSQTQAAAAAARALGIANRRNNQ